jgi:excisionase family DNA binding protein
MSASALPRFVDLATTSESTSVAKSTLRDWIRQGKLPAYRAPGGQIRLLVSDIENLFTRV